MRRPTLAFLAVTAAAGLAFAPLVSTTLPRTAEEVLADPAAVADAYGDAEGPMESYGDLARSVENWPAAAQGELAEHVQSAENLEAVAQLDMQDVLAAYPTGAAKDIGTFLEFFSPHVLDQETGEYVQRDIAVMGINAIGAVLVDITDPEHPERLSVAYCNYHQADVGIYNVGDAAPGSQRWVLAIGADTYLGGGPQGADCFANPINGHKPAGGPTPLGGGDEALALFDVTDPTAPKAQRAVSFQGDSGGAHTIEFDPTRPHAYIASASHPNLTRVDFSDPAEPVYLPELITEGGPHAVRISADGERLYSAGSFSQTMSVHDITDPMQPVPVAVQSTPRNLYTHEVLPAHDRSFVVVADEGAWDPGYGAAGVGGGWCPGTGFWIYDMSVENLPTPLSYTVADADFQTSEGQACAVHYGSLSADNQYYVTSYYGGGVRVFDLTDPADPVEIGHITYPDSDVWTAKAYTSSEYVFTSDLNRGFEVFRWTGEADLAQFDVEG